MKKLIYLLVGLFTSSFSFAQIGINTESPKSNLDVSPVRLSSGAIDPNQVLGLQPPRLSRLELTNNLGVYGTDQIGAVIYVTDVSGGDTMDSRYYVTKVGYYYFDGSFWRMLMPVTARNGLSRKENNDIVLGGALDEDTSIENKGKNLMITGDGNVGIGSSAPGAKLHVSSGTTTGGALLIQDGSELKGKVLTAFDDSGRATWTIPEYAKDTKIGVFTTTGTILQRANPNSYAGSYIVLTKGYWLVSVGVLLSATKSKISDANNNLWVRLSLTSNSSGADGTSGFRFLGSTLISGYSPMAYSVLGNYSFISGVVPIEVTVASITLYLKFGTIDKIGSNIDYTDVWVGSNGENYMFASPTTPSN